MGRGQVMRRKLLVALAVSLLVPAAQVTAVAPGPQTGLPKVVLNVGGHRVTAEVAATPEQRATGLMYRFSLRTDEGMIFVFPRAEPQGFWMRNTYIPLSIAFIDAGGVILNIEEMSPQTETTTWSKGAARYALEMRKGWFRERGIGPGERVKGLPPLTKE